MRKLLIFALLINAALLAGRFWQELPVNAQEEPVATRNGDVNGDGDRNLSDAVYILNWLFLGGSEPVACAQEGGGLTPEQEEILDHMSIVEIPAETDGDGNVLSTAKTIRFTGVNVQIVNGLGATNGNPDDPDSVGFVGQGPTTTNGLGNLIVGYQEFRGENDRTGSHNIVVGIGHNYSSFGGLVGGRSNTISGTYSSVSGGRENTASGVGATVSGGVGNSAEGGLSSVSGGLGNTASGGASSVSGGENNTASGLGSSVSGGFFNTAEGDYSSVSGGGGGNTAEGRFSTVSGGRAVTATGEAEHAP